MKIMILGGAGFIGSNFVHFLSRQLNHKDDVTIVDRLSYAGKLENIEDIVRLSKWTFTQKDICNYEAIEQVIKVDQPDVLINFAAETHVSRSITAPKEFTQCNIIGVENVLQSILHHSKNTFLVHISTDEVFGQQSEFQKPWNDYDQLNPRSPYAASKAAGELLVRSYFTTYGLDSVIVRPSNCFGPYQFPEKLIPRAVTNLIEGKKVPMMGEGREMRDWLFVDDLCEMLWLIIQEKRPGECYNIPGHAIHRNRDIIRKILKYLKFDETMIERIPARLAHDFKYHVAGEGISHLITKNPTQITPNWSFDEKLSYTINWYKFNTQWWLPLKEEAEKGNQNADKL